MTKPCTNCKEIKPFSEFYSRGRKTGGLTSECKGCFRTRMGQRHQRHKDQLVEEAGGECQRCGYDRCSRVMEFHHIDPTTKSFEISDRLSSSLKVLREEVAKCMLLCPTCHAEKHQNLW